MSNNFRNARRNRRKRRARSGTNEEGAGIDVKCLFSRVEKLLKNETLIDANGAVDTDTLISELKKAYPVYETEDPALLSAAVCEGMNRVQIKGFSNAFHPELETSVYSDRDSYSIQPKRLNLMNSSIKNLYQSPKRDALSTPRGCTLDSSMKRTQLDKELYSGNQESRSRKTPVENEKTRQKASESYKMKASTESDEAKKLQQTDRSVDGEIEQTLKKRMKKGKDITLHQPTVKFSDLGGIEPVLEEICKLLMHLKHPEVYKQLGVVPPRGFLLHGPPGCGKTLLAHAIAGQVEIPLIKVAAPEIVAGVSGESEERIRELFDKAVMSAPCILFIDEIDAITPKRDTAQKEMERRIVAQLLTSMDELSQKDLPAEVLVIGATNRPDSLDPALRRAGRFDREIALGIPDENARERILKVLCKKLRLQDNFDFKSLAHRSPGYVGADLMALTREATMSAVTRVFRSIEEKFLQAKESSILDNHTVTEQGSDKEPCQNDTGKESIDMFDKNSTILLLDNSTKVEREEMTLMEIDHKKHETVELQEPLTEEIHSDSLKNIFTLKRVDDPSKRLELALMLLSNIPPLNQSQLDELFISMEDFEEALKLVQPSAKREGFATIPDVTWSDIGALTKIREALQMAILAPVRHREKFEHLGLTSPSGILLHGPPGCGKTLLAKAIANESGINFISVKGPELLNMYVGESERAVRQCFQRAKTSAPCVIFFDEIDALCPRRTDSSDGGASSRVVNQMLTELDGLESRRQVFVLAATNRPDIIDPAMLRPGRLDEILFVGLPICEERLDILKTITRNGTKPPLADDVSLKAVAEDDRCQKFSGADLSALVRQASLIALSRSLNKNESSAEIKVTAADFDAAFVKVKASNK